MDSDAACGRISTLWFNAGRWSNADRARRCVDENDDLAMPPLPDALPNGPTKGALAAARPRVATPGDVEAEEDTEAETDAETAEVVSLIVVSSSSDGRIVNCRRCCVLRADIDAKVDPSDEDKDEYANDDDEDDGDGNAAAADDGESRASESEDDATLAAATAPPAAGRQTRRPDGIGGPPRCVSDGLRDCAPLDRSKSIEAIAFS